VRGSLVLAWSATAALSVGIGLSFAVSTTAEGDEGTPEERVMEFLEDAHRHISRSGVATSSTPSLSDTSRPARTRNLKVLASHDLGGGGFHTDVWALGNYAYVGSFGVFPAICPDGGVKVIDISDPTSPDHVATIAPPSSTQTNDVKAARIATKHFKGDILVVSNEWCRFGGAAGFQIFDVTDPENATELGRYGPATTSFPPSAPFFQELIDWGQGVHNTFIFEQKGRVYVAAVVDFGEIYSLLYAGQVASEGDLRIVDITDPANPTLVGSFGISTDLGQNPFAGQGEEFPYSGPHDVWVENGVAYVSEWDAGLVLVDVSDPSSPKAISQTKYAASEEGNTHVAVPARGGNLVLVGDEDFTYGPWGFLRIFDTRDASAPKEIATFGTPNTIADPPPNDGVYTMHNVVVRGNSAYISWYGDGVRVIDFSRATRPREIASFVPADTADPLGYFPPRANVWGIYVHGDLILASDTNSGLHILKHTK
jgi:hypothetical protein